MQRWPLFFCGYMQVRALFSGLERPGRPQNAVVYLGGTVDVTRTYGCQSESGKLLPKYDRRVVHAVGVSTRRGLEIDVPNSGDVLEVSGLAFPAGLTARQLPVGYSANELQH